jgi:hypothetical protein
MNSLDINISQKCSQTSKEKVTSFLWTAAGLLNNHSHQRTFMDGYENKESITLIWFDPFSDLCQDIEHTKTRFCEINNHVVFHSELVSCIVYVESIRNEAILLITSSARAHDILPRIVNRHHIDSILIFGAEENHGRHLPFESYKVSGIYTNFDELCTAIEEQVGLIDKQMEDFAFFDQCKKPTIFFPKESFEFFGLHLYKQVIKHLRRDTEGKTR